MFPSNLIEKVLDLHLRCDTVTEYLPKHSPENLKYPLLSLTTALSVPSISIVALDSGDWSCKSETIPLKLYVQFWE
jgi:hypothetical protein